MEFDIVVSQGDKSICFSQDLPTNLEIALHTVYYEPLYTNIKQNAYIKIKLLMFKNLVLTCKLFIPAGFYISFEDFRMAAYREAKKNRY